MTSFAPPPLHLLPLHFYITSEFSVLNGKVIAVENFFTFSHPSLPFCCTSSVVHPANFCCVTEAASLCPRQAECWTSEGGELAEPVWCQWSAAESGV